MHVAVFVFGVSVGFYFVARCARCNQRGFGVTVVRGLLVCLSEEGAPTGTRGVVIM